MRAGARKALLFVAVTRRKRGAESRRADVFPAPMLTVRAPMSVSPRRSNDGTTAGLELESSEGVAMLRLTSRVPPQPRKDAVRG
jgi:hypothetical protein